MKCREPLSSLISVGRHGPTGAHQAHASARLSFFVEEQQGSTGAQLALAPAHVSDEFQESPSHCKVTKVWERNKVHWKCNEALKVREDAEISEADGAAQRRSNVP